MHPPFKVIGVNHTGLAPKDPTRTREFFSSCLGLPYIGDELVASQRTMTAIFGSRSTAANDESPQQPTTRLEILSDDGQGVGPIAKFLEKKGAGIHHVALTVDNVQVAIEWLKRQGVRLVDEVPRPGAHKTMIAFVHPESTGGILVELVEETESGRSPEASTDKFASKR